MAVLRLYLKGLIITGLPFALITSLFDLFSNEFNFRDFSLVFSFLGALCH